MRVRDARLGVGAGRALLLYVAFACLVCSAGGTSSASDVPIETAPTLLISFDGFRASYLDAQDERAIPELTALWRAGVRASLRPRFISKTFPNHHTLVTGLNENTHGIVANRFFDPDLNKSFTTASTESFWWTKGEPLWVTAKRDGRDTRVYYWPGSASQMKDKRPNEWFPYVDDTEENLFTTRIGVVAEWLVDAHRGAKTHNPNASTNGTNKHPFFAMYFEEPDASGHKHGPFGGVTKQSVRDVDTALGKLRRRVGDEVWEGTNVVIVSDHGMSELSPDRVVFLHDTPCGLPFEKVHVEGSDVVMHVWPLGGSGKSYPVSADQAPPWFDADKLASQINNCHPHVNAWTRDSVPTKFAYGGNKRVGPVVVAADDGWTLCGVNASGGGSNNQTNETYAHERDWSTEHAHCVASLAASSGHRGAHGFDNDAVSMRAVFIASGPSFRKDGARLVGDFLNRDGVSGLTGADANANQFSERDAANDFNRAASFWEPKTFAFNNTAVFPILAAALGIPLDPSLNLADGYPPPTIDGVLSPELSAFLFSTRVGTRNGDEGSDEDEKNSAASPFLLFAVPAFFSFIVVNLAERYACTRWPFAGKGVPTLAGDTDETVIQLEGTTRGC